MKTVSINLFKFDELSEDAQQIAIDEERNSERYLQHYFDEVTDSVKAVLNLFDLKTGRTYSDVKTSHIDDAILNLSGVRLYKYLVNNYYNSLFTPQYKGLRNRAIRGKQMIFEVRKGSNGNEYTQIYSKLRRSCDCPLTGVCYDMDILKPVLDFLKRPDKGTTFENLISETECAIRKTYENTEDWLSSDEFIKEDLQTNGIEFTEDGNRY